MSKSFVQILVSAFLVPSVSFGIANGRIPEPGDSMASRTVLLFGKLKGGREGTCSGSLLENNLILTAAHCLPPILESGYVAFALDDKAAENPATHRKIVAWRAHEKFWGGNEDERGDRAFDLALLRFEGELPAGYNTFQLSEAPVSQDAEFFIAGFGKVAQLSPEPDRILRVTTLPRNALLSETFAPVFRFDQAVTGACVGDSGGPLAISENGSLRLVGVIAAGAGVNAKGEKLELKDYCVGVGIYSSVQSQFAWIQKVSKEL